MSLNNADARRSRLLEKLTRLLIRLAVLSALGLAVTAAPPPARAEGFTESWYLLRGRANMKIGNHKAAIEAFEKAVALNPDNREAMRTLGVAYGLEGQTDKAVAQFDRYLAHWHDDAEIAFQQAEYLSWSRYDYRRADAVKYLKMGLAEKDDPRQRRRLALLLGRDKSTVDEALVEYEKLLAASPDDETLRAESRKLLSGDKRHLGEAIKENEAYVKAHPGEFTPSLELAKLLAQDPRRRADAAELYGQLVEKRPNDTGLRLEHARLLAGLSGEEAAASAEYEQVLKRKSGDIALRTEYADSLAKQPSRRSDALTQYRTVLEHQPRNQSVRLKLARLELADKAGAADAAKQYEIVLAAEPNNAEAHRGAASAYAWLGDSDRALMHGRAAAALGNAGPQVQTLTERLSEGREPRIGLRADVVSQPGSGPYTLLGYEIAAFARRDLGPFATLAGAIGGESYQDSQYTVAGPTGEVSFQYRFTKEKHIDVRVAEAGVGPGDRRASGSLAYTFGDDSVQLTPGVRREIRRDSLLAVAGVPVGPGTPVAYGAARADDAFFQVSAVDGPTRYDVTPIAGVVSTADGDRNPYAVVQGGVERLMSTTDGLNFGGAYRIDAEHYQADHSGYGPSAAEPLAGGYVSPQLLLDQSIRFVLRTPPEDATLSAYLSAGPGLQLVRTGSTGTTLVTGAEADAGLAARLDGFAVEMRLTYLRLPDVNNRVEATASLAKLY